VAASNMAMINQEFDFSGLPSVKPYLRYLLENGAAKHSIIRWGQSYRKVIFIGGKKYQYKGDHDINKNLKSKIAALYISMSEKASNRKSETLKDNAATKIIGAFHKRIKLKIDKVDVSMKGKVKSVRVVSVGVGKNQYGNIEALIESAFRVAQREMPSQKNMKYTLT